MNEERIIITNAIRGKGKIKNCLGIREMYKYYKSITDKTSQIKYNEFSNIIKKCNKELINKIVNESEIVTLPYRLGELQISKSERSYNPDYKRNWSIDFQKSKENGFVVYHDQEYIYRWAWKKHYAIVRNKTGYKFTANRSSKRLVAAALKRRQDYFK